VTWFPPAAESSATTRLFCLPHGGAGASAYQSWADRLPADLELAPVRLPGREARFAEPPARSAAELVEALIEPLLARAGARFVLFGHSLGGLLAYELARAATRAGHPPAHLVVSGCAAPHLLPRPGEPTVHTLSDEDLLAHVRALAGPSAPALAMPELARLLVPVLRADYEVYETYRHQAGEPLPVPITALAGADDPETTAAELAAWRDLTTRGIEQRIVPGGHLYLLARPDLAIDAVLAGAAGLTG